MQRLDHTNIDFEELSKHCSPFLQELVAFVVQHMHQDMEAFFKEHCQSIDDDEDLHRHRYWDLFQGEFLTGHSPALPRSLQR